MTSAKIWETVDWFEIFYSLWPVGRPDMAYYKFTSLAYDKKITLNNSGNMYRDFTYIDDVNNLLVK